jgi:hypothetical protein
MVRLLALMDKLIRAGAANRRPGAERPAGAGEGHPEILERGAGVMLGFDVVGPTRRTRTGRPPRPVLSAGERTLRSIPATHRPYAIDEALSILRHAVDDVVGSREAQVAGTVKVRVGTLEIPLETVEILDLTPATFETLKLQILAVEQERYGPAAPYPPDVLRAGHRPLLQFPIETLETTMANSGAIGVVERDRVSRRLVGYVLGSALENHDEEGSASDPHAGEGNTFYLQALATLPTVQNQIELENALLDAVRDRVATARFDYLSSLIDERVVAAGPEWLRTATVLDRFENYLRSGTAYVYIQADLRPKVASADDTPSV